MGEEGGVGETLFLGEVGRGEEGIPVFPLPPSLSNTGNVLSIRYKTIQKVGFVLSLIIPWMTEQW